LEEKEYWLGLLKGKEESEIPIDNPGTENTEAKSRSLSTGLDEKNTQIFLGEIPNVYHTQVNDLLLTSLLIALSEWSGREEGRWLIDLEGHGREELFEEVDVTRTVGWFTSLYPVLLEKREGETTGELIKNTKEMLRKMPRQGIGYGLLRYLSGDQKLKEVLSRIKGRISFNYLGQTQNIGDRSFLKGAARESTGNERSGKGKRDHEIDIVGIVSNGKLEINVTYNNERFRAETMERFASCLKDGLQAVIEHCLSPEAGGFTPSDFPLAEIEQEILDKWSQEK